MNTFIAILHVLTALVLISLVLIQDSKGDGALGMGGGGGGSNSVFGATGASTLAAKMTRIAAIIFALTSIGLSVLSSQQSKSVLDQAPMATSAPTTTAPAPAPETAQPQAAPEAPAQQAPAQEKAK
ncbi:MAG: preprotein translocase subunit SecG [Bdellovibrionaceae bacterium]|nr:preprotein translocase subunit SecG [Pseudobdellovibrionaceae bacterium]